MDADDGITEGSGKGMSFLDVRRTEGRMGFGSGRCTAERSDGGLTRGGGADCEGGFLDGVSEQVSLQCREGIEGVEGFIGDRSTYLMILNACGISIVPLEGAMIAVSCARSPLERGFRCLKGQEEREGNGDFAMSHILGSDHDITWLECGFVPGLSGRQDHKLARIG